MSAARATAHAAKLMAALLRVPKPDVILVQNPPAVPTLAVAWTVARMRGARLVVDWHNLSHTILAVKLGDGHRAVRSLARSERRWARRADAHLAVSQALADWLKREWKVNATVVYDRPPSFFAKPSLATANELWQRLAHDLHLGARRVPLVVCPTSWTPDEDFDLLLEALERAERTLVTIRGKGEAANPDLAVMLTGRGQLRSEFERRLARRALTRIGVRTSWLEPGDYPTLVGMAEAGLCLHAPVINEAISVGREGITVRDPGELAAIFVALATADLGKVPQFAASRSWLAANAPERWDDQWRARALPVLDAK
jgi:beta-1,4-mannosyltransferase